MNILQLKAKLESGSKMIEKYETKKIPNDIGIVNPAFADLFFDIQYACRVVGWYFSDNYAQWDYWHCTNSTGGLFRFSLKHLLEKLDEIEVS